jgi:hypothetical protein
VASRSKLRESESEFPAPSVCVATTSLLPSPAVKLTVELNTPPAHEVVAEALKPEPFKITLMPDSQVPEIVAVAPTKLPAAGDVMAMAGANESRIKLRVAVPALPTESVCEARTSFVPSPAVNKIAPENVPVVQLVVTFVCTPGPHNTTEIPVSHVPETVKPVCATVFAAGAVIAMDGAVLSR